MTKFSPNNVTIRYERRRAVMVLPIVMVLISIHPLIYLFPLLASWFGIDINAPIQWQQNDIKLAICMLLIFIVLVFCGYYLGWFLNGFVLRFFYKWPREKVFSFLIHLETPLEWLEDNSAPQSDTDAPQ